VHKTIVVITIKF